MIAYNTNRDTSDRKASAFISTDSRTAEQRSTHLANSSTRHRNLVRHTRELPTFGNGTTEILADIEGLPVLVRLLVQNVPAEMRSDHLHSRLSSTLEKAV